MLCGRARTIHTLQLVEVLNRMQRSVQVLILARQIRQPLCACLSRHRSTRVRLILPERNFGFFERWFNFRDRAIDGTRANTQDFSDLALR